MTFITTIYKFKQLCLNTKILILLDVHNWDFRSWNTHCKHILQGSSHYKFTKTRQTHYNSPENLLSDDGLKSASRHYEQNNIFKQNWNRYCALNK